MAYVRLSGQKWGLHFWPTSSERLRFKPRRGANWNATLAVEGLWVGLHLTCKVRIDPASYPMYEGEKSNSIRTVWWYLISMIACVTGRLKTGAWWVNSSSISRLSPKATSCNIAWAEWTPAVYYAWWHQYKQHDFLNIIQHVNVWICSTSWYRINIKAESVTWSRWDSRSQWAKATFSRTYVSRLETGSQVLLIGLLSFFETETSRGLGTVLRSRSHDEGYSHVEYLDWRDRP